MGRTSHPNQSEGEWGTTNLAILITDGVREGKFGMVTVFCHPHQAKIEACDALSTLHQRDSSEPSVVVVRRYSNTPYIPTGMSHSLYLDVDSLSGGASSTQFPLDRLCLCWIIPFTRNEVLLPHEEGEESTPHLPEILWEGSAEEHHLSDLTSLLVPMFAPSSHLEEGTQTEGGSDHHPTNTHTEGGSGYHPSLKLLQDTNQARAQLEYELIQETQELVERYEHK